MIKQSKAIRYGLLIGVLSLWVDVAQATPVVVNSGQHSGFVRLVFPVPHPSQASVKIEEDKVSLSFPKELSIDFYRVNSRLSYPVFPHFVTNGSIQHIIFYGKQNFKAKYFFHLGSFVLDL